MRKSGEFRTASTPGDELRTTATEDSFSLISPFSSNRRPGHRQAYSAYCAIRGNVSLFFSHAAGLQRGPPTDASHCLLSTYFSDPGHRGLPTR